MPAWGATTRMTPCDGASTPVTRALRVYSPRQKKAASAKVTASAETLMKVKDNGRMSTMRPSSGRCPGVFRLAPEKRGQGRVRAIHT
jgi:hypothetical protein